MLSEFILLYLDGVNNTAKRPIPKIESIVPYVKTKYWQGK